MPIGSHILKNPNDENEILERLPKEVRDALSTLQCTGPFCICQSAKRFV
jgi:hypothetical protein